MRIIILFLFFMVNQIVIAQTPATKFIEVSGYAEMEMLADYLEISVSVKENDNIRKENEFALKERAVLDAFKQNGIPEADISVDNFNAYRFGINNSSNRYSLAKTFLIKVRDVKSIDTFIIRLYEAGASEVLISRKVKTDIEKYKSDVVKSAVTNARLRALEIAATLNLSLGTPLQIVEIQNQETFSPPNRNSYEYAYKKMQLSATGAVHRGMELTQDESIPNADIRKMMVSYRVMIQFEISK